MWTLTYWLDVLERAIKTAAQFALYTAGADLLNVFSADWKVIGGSALAGGFLSVITSLGSLAIPSTTGPPTASLVPAVEYEPPQPKEVPGQPTP